ncbi:hypothetical protein BDY24DRAFT_374315 [Mrakia frigida]|uniref:uncharacterized protein n=1 Tax=Mrakia frigida TaxID=29902 RepID=UPI003FCC033E
MLPYVPYFLTLSLELSLVVAFNLVLPQSLAAFVLSLLRLIHSFDTLPLIPNSSSTLPSFYQLPLRFQPVLPRPASPCSLALFRSFTIFVPFVTSAKPPDTTLRPCPTHSLSEALSHPTTYTLFLFWKLSRSRFDSIRTRNFLPRSELQLTASNKRLFGSAGVGPQDDRSQKVERGSKCGQDLPFIPVNATN